MAGAKRSRKQRIGFGFSVRLIGIEGTKPAATAGYNPLVLGLDPPIHHMTTIPEGFGSMEHLVQEATIWTTNFNFL